MTGTNMKERLEKYAKREVAVAPRCDTYNVPFTDRRMDVCVHADKIEVRVTDWFEVCHETPNKGFGHIRTTMPYTWWYVPESEKRALRALTETDKYVQENLRDMHIAWTYAHYIYECKFGKMFN